MSHNKINKSKNKLKFPWWVWIISILFLLVGFYFDFLRSNEFNIETTLKIVPFIFALFAIYLTVERMKQTEKQIDAISENNKYRNYQDHLEKFIKHFSEDEIVKKIAEINGIEVIHLISEIYRFFYYTNHLEFVPTYNDFSSKFIYEVIDPLINRLYRRDNIREDIWDVIASDLGALNNFNYSDYIRNIVKKELETKENFEQEKIYPALNLYYHFRILIKLSGFERLKVFNEDELIDASKNLTALLSN